MSEELYNSNDYCKLAEELEELKKENAELARDKDHLMNLLMESSEYVYSVVSNMKIESLTRNCKALKDDNEELKKENAELLADKLYLIGAAMDGGNKYHYAAHDIGYRDMERKVKALEADYVISNRELLILQSRIAELEAAQRWIPVSERLPEEFTPVLAFSKDNDKPVTAILAAGFWWSNVDDAGFWSSDVDWALNVTHWMPLPQPPEEERC